MKGIGVLLALAVCLTGQEPDTPAANEAGRSVPASDPSQAAAPQKAAADPQPAPAAAQAAPAGAQAAPAAAGTPEFITGYIDAGYRWVSDVGGNLQTYQSVVGLGEGPRLFGLDVAVSRYRQYWDRVTILAHTWGGEPYSTFRLFADQARYYRLSIDYRNIAYFNFLPSFANPLIDQGVLLNQRSLNFRNRFTNVELDLLPARRVVPYIAYTRNSGSGEGITPFVAQSNEYPIAVDIDHHLNAVRGGVRFEFPSFHVTAELGGTTFEDRQRLFSVTDFNPGNRTTPLLGQQLFLTSAEQNYDIDSSGVFTRVLFTAPTTWINFYGQVLYSRPETDVSYSETATGNFVLLAAAQFYDLLQLTSTGDARLPQTTLVGGFQLFPRGRLRILESITSDRMSNTSSGLANERLAAMGMPVAVTDTVLGDQMKLNYHRQQVDAVFDITRRFTIRGGHRFVWGDATTRTGTLFPQEQATAEFRRHVGLAGVTYRPNQRFTFNGDFEGSAGQRTLFRTGLLDYQRFRSVLRYQALTSLVLTGNFNYFRNRNPDPAIDFESRVGQLTLSLYWTPGGGSRFSALAEYTRSAWKSDILYLVPQVLQPEISRYRDNAHIGVGLFDIALPSLGKVRPRISAGGSFVATSGSRPSRYYQPVGKLLVPVHRCMDWYADWRWYSLAQPFYTFEEFRAHQLLIGLRLHR